MQLEVIHHASKHKTDDGIICSPLRSVGILTLGQYVRLGSLQTNGNNYCHGESNCFGVLKMLQNNFTLYFNLI